MRSSMKKQQPNICKLRKFLNSKLNEIEYNLFSERECSRYSGESYVNNSRSKAISLSYYYESLERISFSIKGQKPLVIMRESDYAYEYEEDIDKYNYQLVSDDVDLKDYITSEMKAVMHEDTCRQNAKHRKFKKFRKSFIEDYIKECYKEKL